MGSLRRRNDGDLTMTRSVCTVSSHPQTRTDFYVVFHRVKILIMSTTNALAQVSPNNLDQAPPQSKESVPVEKEKVEVVAVTDINRNDDSNPQQGTGANLGSPKADQPSVPTRVTTQRPSLKIPPTTKDDRKLFVGGLPADSKYIHGVSL